MKSFSSMDSIEEVPGEGIGTCKKRRNHQRI
jgi:hypothetical protein